MDPEDIEQILRSFGLSSERQTSMATATKNGLTYVDLSRISISTMCLDLFSAEVAQRERCIPVKVEERSLWLSLDDINNQSAQRTVLSLTNLRVLPVLTTRQEIDTALEHYFGNK